MTAYWNGFRWIDREPRALLLTIRVTKEERERAELVAKHHGSNVARIVRRYFVEEAKRIAAIEKEKVDSLQNTRKTAESREPRSPPGFRPPKAARKAGEARPPRAEKRRKTSKR
jgi:hypothetical protein